MKLVVVITGSLRAAFTPFWINWIREARPDIELRIIRTRAARAFVTRPALQQLCGAAIADDEWDVDAVGPAMHVELGLWADAVLVYPATLDYVGRVARGSGDTPSLLMIACTSVPVVLAPALPPGGMEGRAYGRHLEDITRIPGVEVATPTLGLSAATRTLSAYTSAPMPECLEMVDRMLAARADTGVQLESDRAQAMEDVGELPIVPSSPSGMTGRRN